VALLGEPVARAVGVPGGGVDVQPLPWVALARLCEAWESLGELGSAVDLRALPLPWIGPSEEARARRAGLFGRGRPPAPRPGLEHGRHSLRHLVHHAALRASGGGEPLDGGCADLGAVPDA